MKKTFKKITSYICLLILIFSLSGCSQFVDLDVGGYGSGSYEEISVTMQLKKQMVFCDTGATLGSLYNSKSVDLGEEDSAEVLSTAEAANKVKRSVVLINILNSSTSSSGSGVIVKITSSDLKQNEYYIMTCHHVISSGGKITVCVPDSKGKNSGDVGYDESYIFTGYIGAGKEVDKENAVCLVGGDRDGDIAILKLKVGNRRNMYGESISKSIEEARVSFPNPKTLSVSYAEEVFAIGNPTGRLPMTYMHGYISYLDRAITLDSVGLMTNLIQHDCLITHGNSGGGLFNMKGQLIGITNAGVEDQPGLSYAIPYYTYSNSLDYGFMYIAEQLIKTNTDDNYGYVQGRWELGVTVADAETGVSGSTLTIKEVATNSVADGLIKKGDYITAMEFLGTKYTVSSMATFVNAVFVARENLQSSSVANAINEIKFTIQRAQ